MAINLNAVNFINVCWLHSLPGPTHLRGEGVILPRSFGNLTFSRISNLGGS